MTSKVNRYIFHKIVCAVRDLPRTFRRLPTPRLIMTLLVKNEEELLEKNLLFHKAMGVDAFIVTDNNSADGTYGIIEKYRRKGWVVDVIRETATGYEQKEWVDRMIWRAKTSFGADWVINAEADEFWYAPSGSLKKELSKSRANVLTCEVRSMYPEEDKPFWQWSKAVRPVTDLEAYDLSLYSLFERQNRKVIHRTDGYLQISMGNHKVRMLPQYAKSSAIRVYHYNVRGRRQFMDKMVNGGVQLEEHKGRHGGRHWRYFYRLYKEGLLEEEYDRVIGKPHFEELCKCGYIYADETIRDVFNSIN